MTATSIHVPTTGDSGVVDRERIGGDNFAEQERQLTAKIAALESDHGEAVEAQRKSNALVEAFEWAAAILRDPAFEFDAICEHANAKERRVLVGS